MGNRHVLHSTTALENSKRVHQKRAWFPFEASTRTRAAPFSSSSPSSSSSSSHRGGDAMRIEEVQSTSKKQRIATHTHIKGLGLDVYALPHLLPLPQPLFRTI
uniref:RuvB-like helicase n=1 Tax=Ananas comosus var. bracteatus TaxID=296719 RepID=A0A6V7QYK2_ANACO